MAYDRLLGTGDLFYSLSVNLPQCFIVRWGRQALWLVLVVCQLYVRPANVLDYEA